MRTTKPVPPISRRRLPEAPRPAHRDRPRPPETPQPEHRDAVRPPAAAQPVHGDAVCPPAAAQSAHGDDDLRSVEAPRPARRDHLLGLAVLLMVLVPAYVASQHVRADDDALDVASSVQDTALDVRLDAQAIRAHIEDVALRYGVSARLVVAIISVESEFNPRAVSRKGARGLMQLMPATASSLSVDDSFDPIENIEAGVRHLRRLIDRFDNDLPLALAAYNAGERAVIVHRGIPPYRETRRYVVRVLSRVDPELARAVVREYARRPASTERSRTRAGRVMDDPAASAKPAVLDARTVIDGDRFVRPSVTPVGSSDQAP